MKSGDREKFERETREQSYNICQEWIEESAARYKILAHLDDIGWRPNKNWFLLEDNIILSNCLMSSLPLPPDCDALKELSHSDSPKRVLMEVLDSLQHPYIYPVLDLDIFISNQTHYACVVMPVDEFGSLKDFIYHVNKICTSKHIDFSIINLL